MLDQSTLRANPSYSRKRVDYPTNRPFQWPLRLVFLESCLSSRLFELLRAGYVIGGDIIGEGIGDIALKFGHLGEQKYNATATRRAGLSKILRALR